MAEQTNQGFPSMARAFLNTFLSVDHPNPREITPVAIGTDSSQCGQTSNHSATQLAPPDSLEATGKRTAIVQAQTVDNSRDDGIAQDVNASSGDLDRPAWKRKIMAKNEDNKREINKIGDDFTDKAIARIEGMSEEKRDKAADEYIRSTDYIMKGVKNVMDLSVSITKYF